MKNGGGARWKFQSISVPSGNWENDSVDGFVANHTSEPKRSDHDTIEVHTYLSNAIHSIGLNVTSKHRTVILLKQLPFVNKPEEKFL